MPEFRPNGIGSSQSGVELTPSQLIRWIDTSPDLGYLREAADRVQGRYDSTTGEINFQRPKVQTVVDRDAGPLRIVRFLFWPRPSSIRGKSCASQEFDQSCSNTVNLMAASTLWDAITTYPLIEFVVSDFAGIFALPAAVALSLGLTAGSNMAGKESCNRTKGKRASARTALVIFLGLSAVRTAFSGVGLDIMINRNGITRGYADQLATEQIDKTATQVKKLGSLRNPTLLDFKDACEATERLLKPLKRGDRLFDTYYVKAYGEYKQQLEMQRMSPKEIVARYGGSISNVPGDCNKYRLQAEEDSKQAGELREKLKTYRAKRESMTSISFLSTYFPELYASKFKTGPNGDIQIKEGGDLVGSAIGQFYSKLINPKQVSSLGFSLLGMLISILLSGGSALMLRSKSKSDDMKMSYSELLLDVREDYLNGYSETLEVAQNKRRIQLLGTTNTKEEGN